MTKRRILVSRFHGEMAPIDRFEEKFIPEPNSGCWLWEALGSCNGYGTFWLNARNERASRAAWLLYRGRIPDGLFVLHRCDVPCCVNPNHLFLGTAQDNTDDMVSKGRARFNGRPVAA